MRGYVYGDGMGGPLELVLESKFGVWFRKGDFEMK